MAEILLSLTIIGVVAAITLPSLTGNINERTWNTQRKALYARMSQAVALMPALNGYGTYQAARGTEGTESYEAGVDNVAETFITEGLAKVLKINNICDKDHVFDCGFASKINTANGNSLDLPRKITNLNTGAITEWRNFILNDTAAAAFETANGESILTFYNPNCTTADVLYPGEALDGTPGYYAKQHVCANMVFDLNGSKGPNSVGKDIGVMSVIYSSDSVVVMPLQPKNTGKARSYSEGNKFCKEYDADFRMPNIEELLSIYYNRELFDWNAGFSWSTTSIDKDNAWGFGHSGGVKYPTSKELSRNIICVKRN